MIYNIIVATCNDNGIGINNTIPWYSIEDMRHFSYITKGSGNNAVVMGRSTWDSIPENKKPLVDRKNIILTKNRSCVIKDCVTMHTISDTIKHIDDTLYDVCWIIGGASVYEQFLDQVKITNIVVTRINEDHKCTVKFPEIPEGYKLNSTKRLGGTTHIIECYVRV